MELLFYLALGAILKIPKLSSGITYNVKAEVNSSFSCFTDEDYHNTTDGPKVIKLYLSTHHLTIRCYLYDIQENTLDNRRMNLVLYTSAGLAPSIQIFNSTYSEVFYFKMSLESQEAVWTVTIPRTAITYNTDIAPIEQWFVRFSMHHGLNMFTTEGTLLDIVREPILQWDIGTPIGIKSLIPDIYDILITSSPCASDVSIIALMLKTTPGIYLGLTISAFTTRDTEWFNMTENICRQLDHDCADLKLVKLILTNTRLIILTTLGLFISEDLRYVTAQPLQDDYFRAKIWYTIQCLANQEAYEVDGISLTFIKDKTLSQVSTCFYSRDPHTEWHSCLPHRTDISKSISRRVVSFLIDVQQNTGIAVLIQQNVPMVSVHKLTDYKMNKQMKFPDFTFPDPNFIPLGMLFFPNSHFLYVYGNQLWLSDDGGNTFVLLIKTGNESILYTDACVYTQALSFVTNKGSVFYIRAGLNRYGRLAKTTTDIFEINFDHLGNLFFVALNDTTEDNLMITAMNVNMLLKEDDLGFDTPLAPQYITEEQMMFFEYRVSGTMEDSEFSNLHIGKALGYGPGGSGIITQVFEHTYLPRFPSSVTVDVLDRFPIESSTTNSCLLNTLTVWPAGHRTDEFLLKLDDTGTGVFKESDVEKTVLIPGVSSLLIASIVDDHTAVGYATMPSRVPMLFRFPPKQWFLYDFGTRNGRKWKIVVDICRYTIQQLDDLQLNTIKYLDLGSTMKFTFRVTPVNIAYRVFHMPLMKTIVGQPNLLDVSTNDYWDDTDSNIIEITVFSNFFEQGKSSIAVIITQASLICDVTTFILTLKNSCSYLKAMHYVLPVSISPSEWLTKEQKTSRKFSVLQDLPVNYRPPSILGIAIPQTEHFYNVDPSKPRMRDYFPQSKTTGVFKQCANKLNRAECNCTDNMRLSFFVAFSDCKERALRMKYPVTRLPLSFTVENEGGSENLSSPYFVTITELNNRTNWEVAGTNETSSMLKVRKYLKNTLNTTLYNPDSLTINIFGSELFHFRVSTIPGVSFCNLFDEFQIYVDDAPLAFPGQYLISTITAVLIGGIIVAAYVMQVYEIPIWSILKNTLRRKNKVASESSVATDSLTSTD